MARAIDLGVITALGNADGAPPEQVSRYFAVSPGLGWMETWRRRANLWPRWLRRNGGYALSLVPTILSFAPFPMRVETPDVGDDKPGWFEAISRRFWRPLPILRRMVAV